MEKVSGHSQKKYHHWLMVLTWIFVAIICIIFLHYAGKPFKIGDISDPRAESTIAKNTMEKKLPFGGSRIFILYKSEELSAHNPTFSSQVKKSIADLKKLSFEHRTISPYQNTKQI